MKKFLSDIVPLQPQAKPQVENFKRCFKRWLAAVAFGILSIASSAAEPFSKRPDWSKYFVDLNTIGTIVGHDERANTKHVWVYNSERAKTRYSPASTFKIPHALFALGQARSEMSSRFSSGMTSSDPTELGTRIKPCVRQCETQ